MSSSYLRQRIAGNVGKIVIWEESEKNVLGKKTNEKDPTFVVVTNVVGEIIERAVVGVRFVAFDEYVML